MKKIFKKLIFSIFIFFSTYPGLYDEQQKIKIGVLVPLTGENKNLGQTIIKATRMALKDIWTDKIEIHTKDSGSNSKLALKAASEFEQMGINIVIGPVFQIQEQYW